MYTKASYLFIHLYHHGWWWNVQQCLQSDPLTKSFITPLSNRFVPLHWLCYTGYGTKPNSFVASQTSPKLFLNLLELEYSGDVAQNEAEILACFDRALQSQMPLESRLLFCQRKVEFLEDFGSDINVWVSLGPFWDFGMVEVLEDLFDSNLFLFDVFSGLWPRTRKTKSYRKKANPQRGRPRTGMTGG